ncbi:hypothetical protein BO71DRAFT_428599 [Aspergillus ellipticus CBS 707.79]|uniref:Uncharacterized protein n=1 Tax=Aspergillus ellipticus CBS 707.79 TaxID=1448320 RepID=A0A319DFE2_9EURO|nr:hypothetical protein BO71DRAFT_428599 [Aspergillus ellipticus CBS 707.79]
MKISPTYLLPTLLATTAWCTPEPHVNVNDLDWSSLNEVIHNYAPTKTANLNNISPPPHLVVDQVRTGVPATVLAELFVPSKRSSLANEFNAGRTPAWYLALPTDAKTYLSDVRRQMRAGEVTGADKGVAKATGSVKGAGAVLRVDLGVVVGCVLGVVGVAGLL